MGGILDLSFNLCNKKSIPFHINDIKIANDVDKKKKKNHGIKYTKLFSKNPIGKKEERKFNLRNHSDHNESSICCQCIQAKIKHFATNRLIDNINTFGKFLF